MSGDACIRLWMREDVPARFRHLGPAEEDGGWIALFLAHLPMPVLTGPTYRRCHRPSGAEGWIPEGMLGRFGTNALHVDPHPEGDGLLLVGSCGCARRTRPARPVGMSTRVDFFHQCRFLLDRDAAAGL